MENALLQFVYKMVRGDVPTVGTLTCPECGSQAVLSASIRKNGELAVSVKCNCIESQLDGVLPWPGWEVIELQGPGKSKVSG